MIIIEYLIGVILRVLLIPLLIFSVITGIVLMCFYSIFSYILGIEFDAETEDNIPNYLCLWPLWLYSKIPGVEIYRKK